MRRHFFLYLFGSAALLAALIAAIALLPPSQRQDAELVIPYNHVRGMAVESQGLPYTLNFQQQKHIIAALNQNQPLPSLQGCAPTAEKLIIYRFNQPDWVIDLSY